MEEVGVWSAIGGGLGEDFGVLTEDLNVVEEGPDVSDWEGGGPSEMVNEAPCRCCVRPPSGG
jgi:hypothetical protein